MGRIERAGVSLHRPDGEILRSRALGQPGPYAINFDGKFLKPKMAFQIKTGSHALRLLGLRRTWSKQKYRKENMP